MLNLTQHRATPEQGCIELLPDHKVELIKLLTFTSIPSRSEIQDRSKSIVSMVNRYGDNKVMIGGAPYFMTQLELDLIEAGIKPFYAFTQRNVTEVDGVKTSVFQHLGFVSAFA